MGFKEEKAKKKRHTIIEQAVRLFMEHGFEDTGMEAIAAASELSLSTVYRCFPSKELIALAALKERADKMAEMLSAVPEDIPVQEALAITLTSAFSDYDREPGRTELLRSILDRNSNVRARLWGVLAEERNRIGQLLAQRLHLSPDHLQVIWLARLTYLLAETAADLWRQPGNTQSASSLVRQLMRVASDPALPAPKEPAS